MVQVVIIIKSYDSNDHIVLHFTAFASLLLGCNF